MLRPNLGQLEAILGTGKVQNFKDISPYLTLKNKVQAEYYFEAENMDDFKKAYQAAQTYEMPIMILGGGSNVAITKPLIAGLVVRNMYRETEVLSEDDKTVLLLVSAGYAVSKLVKETSAAGWEGFEYHLGLPGTVGGAIYMNSKWTKPVNYFGDNLEYAYIMDQKGEVRQVNRDYFKFAYDYSILQDTHELLIGTAFRLKKNDPDVLKQRAQESLAYRKQTQPFGVATSGCFFQNISEDEQKKLQLPTKSAGYLIDHAGLKGTQVGDFVVSDIHANFIINKGTGKTEDLQALLKKIKDTVNEKYGVQLKEEVIII